VLAALSPEAPGTRGVDEERTGQVAWNLLVAACCFKSSNWDAGMMVRSGLAKGAAVLVVEAVAIGKLVSTTSRGAATAVDPCCAVGAAIA